MKTRSLKLSTLAAAAILAGTTAFTLVGCGGSSSTTTDPLAKISGTVPGTLIEAFCEDGSYYSVTSTQNGTDQHPFEIEIPSTMNCSLVMTTNEDNNDTKVITQIGIISNDTNGTLFTAATDIDLGHIDLAMNRDGIDDDNDGVADEILSIDVNNTLILVELEKHPMDDDDDGILNVYEDDDDDGINNHDDDDDDDDGIPDIVDTDNDGDDIEGNDNDNDDDGIDNDIDVDDDNDGIDDSIDSDDDNDGIDDDEDNDDDNDGIDDDLDDDNDTEGDDS